MSKFLLPCLKTSTQMQATTRAHALAAQNELNNEPIVPNMNNNNSEL